MVIIRMYTSSGIKGRCYVYMYTKLLAPFDKCFPVIVIALCSDTPPSHPHHARVALQDVQQHYEALLQMYGEKAEEAEELKMDIQDLKSLYRQQVSGRECVYRQ